MGYVVVDVNMYATSGMLVDLHRMAFGCTQSKCRRHRVGQSCLRVWMISVLGMYMVGVNMWHPPSGNGGLWRRWREIDLQGGFFDVRLCFSLLLEGNLGSCCDLCVIVP